MTKPKTDKKPYRIALTVSIKEGGELGMFTNGLRQNVLFLYRLFEASPACQDVWLTAEAFPEKTPEPGRVKFPIDRMKTITEIEDDIDYLIVIGLAISTSVLKRLRDKGVKVILYKGGNGAVISMTDICANPPKPTAETYDDWDCYDQIWVTPQHMNTYAGWCRTIYRCPVHEVPQVWSPELANVLSSDPPFAFSVEPGKAWRVGILDPNNTVMKTSHYPMLVAEAANRINPEAIDSVLVSNSKQFADNAHFKRFCNRLGLQAQKKLSVEWRYISWYFIAKYCDAVITHQWENGLNYLYYEVLWGGYPLIHNSKYLQEYGYYFESFSPESGGAALLDAWSRHAAEPEAYRQRNEALFASLDPTSSDNINLHEGLLRTA